MLIYMVSVGENAIDHTWILWDFVNLPSVVFLKGKAHTLKVVTIGNPHESKLACIFSPKLTYISISNLKFESYSQDY